MVEHKNQKICIDTSIANIVIKEALEKKEIPELSYWSFKPEVKYSDNSRIDFLLTSPSQQTYLEIKSVTLMREKGLAEFPDTITKRGSKHLEDLSKMVTSGHKAVLLFLCMRKDVNRIRIAASLLFLSGVTVWVSYIDLGSFNIVLAMIVATIKASLVAFYFACCVRNRVVIVCT